jgi:PAS domain S-box-containing protein
MNPPDPLPPAHRRILLIDDHPPLHDDYRKVFGLAAAAAPAFGTAEAALFGAAPAAKPRASFEIASAFQGEEGLAKVRAAQAAGRPYAVAFIDMRMPPGWDGLETTLRLWEVCPDLQVVICTAHSDYSWEEMFERLGESDRLVLLKKPFDHLEVLQLAHTLTEKWRLLQQTRAQTAELEQRVAGRTDELEAANARLQAEVVERARTDEALRQAQKMEAVGQLAGGLAHDFNNVLSVICGYAGLLAIEEDLSEESRGAVREIEAAADRAASLTRRLLAVSRKQMMQMEVLDLNGVLAETGRLLRHVIREDIELRTELAGGPLAVRADRAMLEQVLLNLAVNARDAMPGGGRLEICSSAFKLDEATAGRRSGARAGRFASFSVTDSGSGIPPEVRPRLFEPFFTTKEVGRGTGLGLASTYGIVQQHGGWIEVESEPGRGATFRICLPASEEPAANAGHEPVPPRGRETVLLVEDEAALRHTARLALQRFGYRVVTATSGRNALGVWLEHADEIDLLLTDMVMPDGLSGLELAARLQRERADLRVLLTSGYSRDLHDRSGGAADELHFLPKPYTPAKLAAAVRACLDCTRGLRGWNRAASPPAMNPPSSPTLERILVIDDNPAIHEDFRKIFCEEGDSASFDAAEEALFGPAPTPLKRTRFAIDSALQGEAGLARVVAAATEGRPYAMAFVDVRMPPGWDGIETIARIWEVCPDLQVVICTAYSDYSWDEMIARLGQSDRLVILKKPFDSIEVLQLANALTEKWHLLQQVQRKIDSLQEQVEARAMELVKSEERFQIIAENSADLIAIWDTNGGRVYFSPSHEKVLGIAPAELLQSPPSAQIHPEDEMKVRLATQAAATTGSAQMIEFRQQHRDGSWRVLESRINPVRHAAGGVEHLVMVARDITERTKAEEERRQMEVQLRHAQKMESIGQLAAGIAHEINTPTQYIGDNTAFVQEAFRDLTPLLGAQGRLLAAARQGSISPELLDEVEAAAAAADVEYLLTEIPKAIDQSLQGVQRVAKIVGAMKDFSHPGTGEKSAVDLNRAIESTLTVATNEWKYVAGVVTDFDPALPAVPCLPGEFNQVILNLVVNASHAIADVVGDGSRGKGTIAISTRRDGDWVEVRVGDTGTGIDETIRRKIFDPFFTTKGVGKGTGQGLAIAHSVIVDKHGGQIELESEVGKGSTFILRLPLHTTAQERKAA